MIEKTKGGFFAMLITNGDFMWGTVFDNINKMALQLKIGDCLTFGNVLLQNGCGEPEIRFLSISN